MQVRALRYLEVRMQGRPAVTVTHIGVYDHVSAGNLLFHGALSSSKAVDAGDTFKIAIGDLDISLD